MKALCLLHTLVALLLWGTAVAGPVNSGAVECVILLHGLARTDASMAKMAAALRAEGYHLVNVDYPSRKHTVERLAMDYVGRAIENCRESPRQKIHFVTHSMGGILVRYFLAHQRVAELGRVVMLSPPNRGSELVDTLGDVPGFQAINGPAGQQLGTDEASIPNRLGPVAYPVGIITGSRSINLILSLLIPGEDDGKVSIERARLEGMADFLVVPHTHPMIMNSDQVIHQTSYFLRHGTFERSAE
jgi:pimeloyl-ACP methyl ester carboxylesterase